MPILDFEGQTKVDTELFLRETPEEKVHNELNRLKDLRLEIFPDRTYNCECDALMNYQRIADFTCSGRATLEVMRGDLQSAAKHYKDAYYINPNIELALKRIPNNAGLIRQRDYFQGIYRTTGCLAKWMSFKL